VELYDPVRDVLAPVNIDRSQVVFEQGDVLVVDGASANDGSFQRYFTFKQAASKESSSFSKFFSQAPGVTSLSQPKCREQVQVACKPGNASDGVDGCTRGCVADAGVSDIRYLRGLIGSAIGKRDNVSRAVVLGAGAGVIPYAVLQRFPEASVDAVDLSGDVLAAAPCFGLHASNNVQLVQADGRSYLEGLPDGSVDVLFLDVYDDHARIPACFTTQDFFGIARRKLTPDGTLAMNLVTEEEANVLPSIASAFHSVRIGALQGDAGNKVLIAENRDETTVHGAATSLLQMDPAGHANRLASVFATWSSEPVFTAAQSSGEPRSDAQWCS